MPFYEYQCKNCGHQLEAMQKVSDSPLKKCPHCGKSQLQRLMSAPVFRLKGSGWYETDFKDEKDKKRNIADLPDSDSSKETDSKPADAKSDAKTDAKADAKADGTAGDGKTKEKKEEKPADRADQPMKAGQKKANMKARKKAAKKWAPKAKRTAR